MQTLILAGGLATRMRPLTETIPKALIEVQGLPFIHYQLGWLSRNGCKNVVISIGYRGELIREYCGKGEKWGIRLAYADEGKDLKGTAGALRLALNQGILEELFLVQYGDSFLPVDFREIWSFWRAKQETHSAMMTVFENKERWDKSNILFQNEKVTAYEKNPTPPNARHIDYGLLGLSAKAVRDGVATNEKKDLVSLLGPMAKQGLVAGFEVKERFYEIGSPEGLSDFDEYVLMSRR